MINSVKFSGIGDKKNVTTYEIVYEGERTKPLKFWPKAEEVERRPRVIIHNTQSYPERIIRGYFRMMQHGPDGKGFAHMMKRFATEILHPQVQKEAWGSLLKDANKVEIPVEEIKKIYHPKAQKHAWTSLFKGIGALLDKQFGNK